MWTSVVTELVVSADEANLYFIYAILTLFHCHQLVGDPSIMEQ